MENSVTDFSHKKMFCFVEGVVKRGLLSQSWFADQFWLSVEVKQSGQADAPPLPPPPPALAVLGLRIPAAAAAVPLGVGAPFAISYISNKSKEEEDDYFQLRFDSTGNEKKWKCRIQIAELDGLTVAGCSHSDSGNPGLFEVVLMARGVSKLAMFGFLCKGVGKTKESLFNGHSTKILCSFEDPSLIRFISTISSPNDHSFTVSYLMDSCGFSEDKAIAISKQVQFDNPSKPDFFLTVLQSYEIPNFVISEFITKDPRVLVGNADKFIKPKLEYLKSFGLSVPDLVRLLTYTPYFLRSSLENRIIPHISFLKNIVTTNSNVVAFLCRSSCSFMPDTEKVMAVYIELLRDSGVPDSNIGKIILLQPTAFMRSVVSFKEIVEKFVTKFQDAVPEVLDAYRGKMMDF